MKYLFLAIFIISSSIHLYASFKSNSRLRAQTKGIILLALLGSAIGLPSVSIRRA